MTDDRLRHAYQALSRHREPGTRAECPSPDDLRALVECIGPEPARLSRLDHVMGCPSCRSEFELLRAAAVATAEVRRPWWRGAMVAAVVLLSVGLALALPRRWSSSVTAERGPAGQLRLKAPRGDVAAGQVDRFVWGAVPGALRYDVEVLTPDGGVLLSASTADTSMPMPALEQGRALRWWVRARLPDGDVASDVTRFTLRP